MGCMLVPATEASPILTMGSSWPSSISSIIAAILAADAYGFTVHKMKWRFRLKQIHLSREDGGLNPVHHVCCAWLCVGICCA